MPPLLSIVIVNWNTRDLLKQCLLSLKQAADGNQIEIIVVDNASTDGSVEMIEKEFPVRLIRNETNLGFARANNQGLGAIKSQSVLFLNSDTLVPPATLPKLIEFMNAHPDAGALSPRLTRRDGTAQPFAFGRDPTPGYLFARGWSRLVLKRPLHDWETNEPFQTEWVSGAGLLARRDALEQIHGFDEKFFMYFEDNDLCRRLRQAGWKIYYNPTVSIIHLGGANHMQSAMRRRWYDASLRYFYSKHYSVFARLALELMLPFYRWIN